jgi:hypothetical protein
MKRQYGDRLVFHGAMDNGIAALRRRETPGGGRTSGFSAKGRAISGLPQRSRSPAGNILAMYETGYEEEWAWSLDLSAMVSKRSDGLALHHPFSSGFHA